MLSTRYETSLKLNDFQYINFITKMAFHVSFHSNSFHQKKKKTVKTRNKETNSINVTEIIKP